MAGVTDLTELTGGRQGTASTLITELRRKSGGKKKDSGKDAE
jgi:hypothetical protein